MTTFGIAMGVGRREPFQRVGDLAKQIEDYRFSALWIQDNPLTTKDPYIALAVAAQSTSKLLLGPSVSNPYIRHLSVIANMIYSIDQISEGRALLGVGNGGPTLVHAIGQKPRKMAAFRQDLEDLRTLLSGEAVVRDGGMNYRVPMGERRIPMYVAARGPKMMELSGALADGVIVASTSQPEVVNRKLEAVRKGAQEAGRNPDDLKISLLVNMAVDSESERAVDVLRPFVQAAILEGGKSEIPEEFFWVADKIHEGHDSGSHLAAGSVDESLVPDDLVRYVAVAGTEDECRERLRTLMGLGVDEITFTLMAGGRVERLKTLARVAL
jgi:5,10-methylenetetrahydromethanopterin reductase